MKLSIKLTHKKAFNENNNNDGVIFYTDDEGERNALAGQTGRLLIMSSEK